MIDLLLEPFGYAYLVRAMAVGALVGLLCALLSVFLMLRGWSLIGDALAHSVVPGVAGAYAFGLSLAAGAFFSGGLAALAILFLNQKTNLKEDVVIGLIYTSFLGLGIFIVSLSPTPLNVQTIILGNLLTIADEEVRQLIWISLISLFILALTWRNLVLAFFDEVQARAVGLPVTGLKLLFFTILSASTVAAMQTVGAFLVVAMVVTPGATAYLLADRFGRILVIAGAIGAFSCAFGAYVSFFADASVGGTIVVMQTFLFLVVFVFAPRHGRLRSVLARRRYVAGAKAKRAGRA